MSAELEYTIENTQKVKAAIEAELSQNPKADTSVYLKMEQGLFRANNPIDSDCNKVPVWERKPYQITRDVNDVQYYTPDETGICRRFVDEVKGWLAWNQTDNKWYCWFDNNHWDGIAGNVNADLFSDKLRDQMQYELPANMRVEVDKGKLTIKLNPEFVSALKTAARIHVREMVVKAARSHLVGTFDTNKGIPFKNGIFDPETQTFTEHSFDNYNTTVCPTNLILDVPSFPAGERFFKMISCDDPDWIDALFRALYECLLYGNPNQMFIVFYGSGCNGKGTLIEWLVAALGSLIGNCDATEISRNNPQNRQTTIFDTITRCRILLFRETGGITYNDELIKKITGDKSITLTRIMTGTHDLPVCGTPILITNTLPTVDVGGYSMVRRQVGFPFDYKITDANPAVAAELMTEQGNEWLVSQIINAGLKAKRDGSKPFKQCLPQRVIAFTERMITEADSVLQFLQDCCTRDSFPADDVRNRESRTNLYRAYCAYEYSQTDGRNPTNRKYWITPKTFGVKLAGHDLKLLAGRQKLPNGGNGSNVYQGIRLNSEGDRYLSIFEGGMY